MNTILWIVGEPGLGKTTLARALLGEPLTLVQKPKWTVGRDACAAGHYTGKTFDGADTLSYSGGAEAIAYWQEHLSSMPLTILDGDRLSNVKAVAAMKRVPAPRFCCVRLYAALRVGEQRRATRGSNQNASWIKGRMTKAWNFFHGFDDRLHLHAETSPEYMLMVVREFLCETPARPGIDIVERIVP